MISCPECPNKNQDMFSNASAGKKYLCMKCYCTFYKPGEYSSRKYYKTKPEKKSLDLPTEAPNTVFIEINLIRDRLNKLEEFCRKRNYIQ